MSKSDQSSEAEDVLKRATSAAGGALVGVALGGPAGALIGAVASVGLEPLVKRVWDEVSRDGRRRAASVLEEASRAAGKSPADMAELLAKDERTKLLAGFALAAATRTAYDDKVRALGRALANGLGNDQARIDEEQLIIAAIDDMEAPHVSLLQLMVERIPARDHSGKLIDRTYEAPNRTDRSDPRAWRQDHISEVRPTLRAPVLPALLGTLERHGLIERNDVFGTRLRQAAKEAPQRHRMRYGVNGGPMPGLTASELGDFSSPPSWSPTALGEEALTYFRDASEEGAAP